MIPLSPGGCGDNGATAAPTGPTTQREAPLHSPDRHAAPQHQEGYPMSDPTHESGDLTLVTLHLTPNARRALEDLAQATGDTHTDLVNEALLIYRQMYRDLVVGDVYVSHDGEMTRLRPPAAPIPPIVLVRQDCGAPLEAEVLVDHGAPTVKVRYTTSHTSKWVSRDQIIPDEAIGTAPQDEWYRDTHGVDLGAAIRDEQGAAARTRSLRAEMDAAAGDDSAADHQVDQDLRDAERQAGMEPVSLEQARAALHKPIGGESQ